MDLDHDIEAEDQKGHEDEDDRELEPGDPAVPTDLLELHLQLEDIGVSPKEFKEMYSK